MKDGLAYYFSPLKGKGKPALGMRISSNIVKAGSFASIPMLLLEKCSRSTYTDSPLVINPGDVVICIESSSAVRRTGMFTLILYGDGRLGLITNSAVRHFKLLRDRSKLKKV